jgi:hypothetical protein
MTTFRARPPIRLHIFLAVRNRGCQGRDRGFLCLEPLGMLRAKGVNVADRRQWFARTKT